MDVNVVAEILEKLCQYEEIEEKYDNIIDKLIELGNKEIVENDRIIDKLVESGNQETGVIEDEG